MDSIIELFKHLIHLDFDWLFANYGTAIYTVLFLVIFIETGLVAMPVGSSRVDLQACKLEYSIVSPK